MEVQLVHFPPDQVAEIGLTRLNGRWAVLHSCSNPLQHSYLPLWLVGSPMFGWKEIRLDSQLFLLLVKSVSHPFVTYPYQETYETSTRCRETVPPEILRCGKWLQSNGKWTPSSNKLNKLFFPNKQMEVSSFILKGFSIINHPFWGTPHLWKPPNW